MRPLNVTRDNVLTLIIYNKFGHTKSSIGCHLNRPQVPSRKPEDTKLCRAIAGRVITYEKPVTSSVVLQSFPRTQYSLKIDASEKQRI